MQQLDIRTLVAQYFTAWLSLWQDYQAFYQIQIARQVTEHTWARLIDPTVTHMHGFIAYLDQQAVGIVHVVEHESCWTIQPYAYLQDLYCHENVRGQGIGRALIQHIERYAKEKGCDRVYWLTSENNQAARALYDRVAKKTGFIQYRI